MFFVSPKVLGKTRNAECLTQNAKIPNFGLLGLFGKYAFRKAALRVKP